MPHTPLSDLSTSELEAFQHQVRRRYDAFATRGVKLDLTRGKPASEQLDLSNRLLALPGSGDHRAAAVSGSLLAGDRPCGERHIESGPGTG
jgi:hypothetical protein